MLGRRHEPEPAPSGAEFLMQNVQGKCATCVPDTPSSWSGTRKIEPAIAEKNRREYADHSARHRTQDLKMADTLMPGQTTLQYPDLHLV